MHYVRSGPVDAYRHMAPKDWIPPTTQHQYLRRQQYGHFCPLPSQQLDDARPIPPTTNFCPPLSRIIERLEGMRAHLFYAFALANIHVDRVAVVDPTRLSRLPYSSRSGVFFFSPALLARRFSLSLHRQVFRSSCPSCGCPKRSHTPISIPLQGMYQLVLWRFN
jgi:hypothetical protein